MNPPPTTEIEAPASPTIGFETPSGKLLHGSLEGFLESDHAEEVRGKVQMIFTSPPFPLNRKKRYGNKTGDEYLEWIEGFAKPLGDLLTDDGSLVIEVGNSWEPGKPVMSTLALKALLAVLETGEFNLCQQFVVHNPARLPSPAQWVNVKRIRVKDAYTHVWWMSRTAHPKANNKNVLVEYSKAMRKLLDTQKYNGGTRPSQHNIGEESFLTDHGGAIPSNVLTISNTRSTDPYRQYCTEQELRIHPARMQPELAEFFIRFLTDKDDLVFDPFAGSNTTGAMAEELERRWLGVELDEEYIKGSRGRFLDTPDAD